MVSQQLSVLQALPGGMMIFYLDLTTFINFVSLLITLLSLFITDVRPPLRRRKSRQDSPNLKAAEGKDPSHHRLLHPTVSGVCRARSKADPNVLEELQAQQEGPRGRPGDGERELRAGLRQRVGLCGEGPISALLMLS